MTETDVPRLVVAVGLFLDADQRILWTWNQDWGAFVWPMTKVRPGERPRQAVERAVAEVFGTPACAGKAITLPPDLYVSDRDNMLKLYCYHVIRAEPHPRFAAARPIVPHVWLTPSDALSGDFRPLSAPCLELTGQLMAQGLLPGRSQLTSTLVIHRGPADERCFLLRYNPSWGYALPAKRRGNQDDVLAMAQTVATEELGLTVPADLRLAPARPSTVTLYDDSESANERTFYVHSLFRGVLTAGAAPRSSAPLVWVPIADIVGGKTDAAQAEPEGGRASPGPVSRTVKTILEWLGEF
jgi:hypothetical protein